MKKIILLLLLIPLLSKSQDTTLVTNLQLKGGTIKMAVPFLASSTDTAILNTYQKWNEDYTDGSVPNDNANVTISITKTTTVAFIYGVLLQLPAGFLSSGDNFITDFTTSILSKRNTNTYLDRLCDELEAKYIADRLGIISSSNQLLHSQ